MTFHPCKTGILLAIPIVCMSCNQARLRAVPPQDHLHKNEVRPLPGQLDAVPMFNSNSPEWVKTEGILLSSFPAQGKRVPTAHLNYQFRGPFTLFAHHFTHTPPELQTLYLGVIVHNPGLQPATISVNQAASYLLKPDAPFQEQPEISENPTGKIFSGPGIRAVDNVLRGQRQAGFPAQLIIPPGQSRMLMNHPIPVRDLPKPINGRSSFLRLNSSRPVYVASLAMYAKRNAPGKERAPTLTEWQQLLDTGDLAGPRDKKPSPPDQKTGQLIYSRVAGVQQGSTWQTTLTDPHLTTPPTGESISFVLNTLRGGRLGTEQSQAAPLVVRYPDTAYESHANYGVHYDLTLPLINRSRKPQIIALKLETPFKEEKLSKQGLRFRKPPWSYPYFRGTVRLQYLDEQGADVKRYIHLWHRRGQLVKPLIKLKLESGQQRQVRLDFLYPPDSVPPQVLTIQSLPRPK